MIFGEGAPVRLDMVNGLTFSGLSYIMASHQSELVAGNKWLETIMTTGPDRIPGDAQEYSGMYLTPVTVMCLLHAARARSRVHLCPTSSP